MYKKSRPHLRSAVLNFLLSRDHLVIGEVAGKACDSRLADVAAMVAHSFQSTDDIAVDA